MIKLDATIADFLDNIYELGCDAEPADFKQKVYSELNRLIPADAGIWTSRSDLKNPIPAHWQEDTFTFNLPEAFMSNYYEVVQRYGDSEPDPFHLLVRNAPNQAHKIANAYGSIDRWRSTLYYYEHCELFSVEDVLSVLVVPKEQGPQTVHLISLYRKDKNHLFTEHEVELFQFVYPQLVEAFRFNLFTQVSDDFVSNKSAGILAVMDRFGYILDADQDFERVLDFDPDFSVSLLQSLLLDVSDRCQHTTEKLRIQINFCRGLFFISLLPIDYFEQLSDEQRVICRYIQSGYSDKDIGEALSVSHRRVRYMLDGIFRALKIDSRKELFVRLSKFGLEE